MTEESREEFHKRRQDEIKPLLEVVEAAIARFAYFYSNSEEWAADPIMAALFKYAKGYGIKCSWDSDIELVPRMKLLVKMLEENEEWRKQNES